MNWLRREPEQCCLILQRVWYAGPGCEPSLQRHNFKVQGTVEIPLECGREEQDLTAWLPMWGCTRQPADCIPNICMCWELSKDQTLHGCQGREGPRQTPGRGLAQWSNWLMMCFHEENQSYVKKRADVPGMLKIMGTWQQLQAWSLERRQIPRLSC